MNIAWVIKSKRQKQNLTQTELAALLNVTPQAVSRWEMDISYPDIAMVPKLSQVLRVSADELLGIEPIENQETEPDRNREFDQDADQILNQSQADSIFDYVPVSSPGEGKKVLVVDDVAFMRMILKEILTKQGHTVLQAENGKECLDILQKEEVDVCVLDINMPVMDGIETLRRIREEKQDLRVVMLSALCMESTVKQTLQLGADAFVVKPFQDKCLIERIG
ncbi:MAG: response regulator [Lachnospiraceae bacterium]|nr:response regulator [Lachnospiraceae bacterium]